MLKEARRRLRLSQKELAELSDVSQAYISKLELQKETCNPKLNQVIVIAKNLELNPRDLIVWLMEKELERMEFKDRNLMTTKKLDKFRTNIGQII
ncbi:helix-turn-helix domain-containing protein [Clostridium gasigenes]|uniref:Helix-turn-helix transcriptional regulator n=1 Tax=Clostridium gasigenes TaxID=94869 RepID=A0A7X0VSS9_9CLOT|nr:helix-turn-helix transcriptional regulator [Clostridium gasigenes]MBB6716253.1 helix-turn-helix transcriptional regulator [Clostridium gasigenes]